MRIPVPNNKLVAFTLVGALLTTVVAGALAVPGIGLAQIGEPADSDGASASRQSAADAPEPNENFTPAVQTQSGYDDEEHDDEEDDDEEYDDEEDDDGEYDDEEDDDEEHDDEEYDR